MKIAEAFNYALVGDGCFVLMIVIFFSAVLFHQQCQLRVSQDNSQYDDYTHQSLQAMNDDRHPIGLKQF